MVARVMLSVGIFALAASLVVLATETAANCTGGGVEFGGVTSMECTGSCVEQENQWAQEDLHNPDRRTCACDSVSRPCCHFAWTGPDHDQAGTDGDCPSCPLTGVCMAYQHPVTGKWQASCLQVPQ